MNFSGIYASIIGLSIATIASIIGIYDGNNKIGSTYLFLIISIAAVISMIGIYFQWKESETVKFKTNYQKDYSTGKFVCKVPYKDYRKTNPIITMIGPNYENCWFEGPKEIDSNGTIILENDIPLNEDRYILIK